MQITYAPPGDRGVTTLMYVGDDDAVDKATSGPSTKTLLMLAGAGVLAYFLLTKQSARERSAARVRKAIARRR